MQGAVSYSVKEATWSPKGTKLCDDTAKPLIGHFGPIAILPDYQGRLRTVGGKHYFLTFSRNLLATGKGYGGFLLQKTEEALATLGASAVEVDLINYRTDLTQFYLER